MFKAGDLVTLKIPLRVRLQRVSRDGDAVTMGPRLDKDDACIIILSLDDMSDCVVASLSGAVGWVYHSYLVPRTSVDASKEHELGVA